MRLYKRRVYLKCVPCNLHFLNQKKGSKTSLMFYEHDPSIFSYAWMKSYGGWLCSKLMVVWKSGQVILENFNMVDDWVRIIICIPMKYPRAMINLCLYNPWEDKDLVLLTYTLFHRKQIQQFSNTRTKTIIICTSNEEFMGNSHLQCVCSVHFSNLSFWINYTLLLSMLSTLRGMVLYVLERFGCCVPYMLDLLNSICKCLKLSDLFVSNDNWQKDIFFTSWFHENLFRGTNWRCCFDRGEISWSPFW